MNTPQTDTPETDAACGTGNWIHCVDADFCRTLERRAIAAEARVKELEGRLQIDPGGSDKIDELESAINFLKDTIRASDDKVKELEASLRLRPIAEAGPVPDGMIRLYAHRIPYGPCGGDFWAAFSEPGEEDTDYIDIYPPQQ